MIISEIVLSIIRRTLARENYVSANGVWAVNFTDFNEQRIILPFQPKQDRL